MASINSNIAVVTGFHTRQVVQDVSINGWLEDDRFLLGPGPFSGTRLVFGSVYPPFIF